MTTATVHFGQRRLVIRKGGVIRFLRVSVRRARRSVSATRSRRVVLLLALLWVCSSFDLLFTLMAHQIGNFHELNPLANALLHNPPVLIAYKLAMMGIGSFILFIYRTRWFAELACWGVCAVYVGLSVVWLNYYQAVHAMMP